MDLKVETPETFDLPTLAAEAGQLAPMNVDGAQYLWRHRTASFLHGWEQYEYHRGPVLLSKADYAAALKAVDSQEVHAPAARKA
jgi:hypothetical protein